MSIAFIERILTAASEDEKFRMLLMERPAQTLRECGFCVPEEGEKDFTSLFWDEVSPVMNAFLQNPLPNGFMNLAGAKCAACKISAWSIGLLIIGLGGAGIAALSVSSPAVVALAAFLGVAPAVALAFIAGPLAALIGDIRALLNAICVKLGVYP